MENLSHSVHRNQTSATLSKKVCNGNGFTFKTVYDDVFGGPPKFGVPTFSPRVEDYSEIFGSFHASRASSIPILDLPVVDEADVSFDVRSSMFDYSEVFGGFNGLDFAVSYEELFNQTNGGDDSSEEAWTPAETESLSEESDRSVCSEKNQCLSNGDSHQSFDGTKQFNISYHKANQRSKEDMSNGTTHITQLHAVPGFTFVVDETTPLQNTEDENPPLQVTDDFNLSMDFSGEMMEGKCFQKTMSHPPNSSAGIHTFGSDLVPQRGYGKNGSPPNEMFLTISEISLRTRPSQLPPPSRPPPGLAVKGGDFSRLTSNLKASKNYAIEGTAGDSSPPFFDVEVDASSSAAASAAAMKEAMEKAQAKLKSAKELMERKKEGLQSRTKLGSKNGIKGKEGKVSKIFDGSNSLNDQRVQGTSEREHNGMVIFAGEERQKVMKTNQVVPDSIEREKRSNVAKISAGKKHGKESRSSQEAYKTEGAGEWTEAAEFYELVRTDKSRKAFEQSNDEKILMQNTKACEYGQKEKKAAMEAFEQQEENEKKLRAAKEACEWEENKGKQKAAKEVRRQQEHENKVKMAQQVREWEGNEKKLSGAPKHEETEKKLTEADEWKEHENLMKVQQKENDVEVKEAMKQKENEQKLKEANEKVESAKKLKDAHEREEYERRLKEAFEQEENERRLKEAIERAENEKRLKEALEQEENEKRLNEKKQKEAREREENEKRLKDALVREENERRLREALEWEEKKRLKEALERDENEKKQKEAREREENEKRVKEALEQEENERRLKAAFVQENAKKQKEENEKRLLEVHEKDENERRLKEACEREEDKKIFEEAHEREESEKRLKEAFEWEEIEKRSNEASDWEETEKRLKVAGKWEQLKGLNKAHEQTERGENEKLKVSNEACKLDENENPGATQVASKHQNNTGKLEASQEALAREENGKIRTEPKDSEKDLESIEVENVLTDERIKASGIAEDDSEHEKNQIRMEDSTESPLLNDGDTKSGEAGIGIGQTHAEKNKKAFQMASDLENQKVLTHEQGERRKKNIKEVQVPFDQEESKDRFMSTQVGREWVQNGRKKGAGQPSVMEGKGNTQKTAQQVNAGKSTERKEKNLNETLTLEEREKEERMKRERELEKDRLRKIEEEREREREREKDRMAVERATCEARERAFAEARDRAERAALGRATAETRQRAMTEARERLEKACAEAREKSLAEKAPMEARVRAERAAVERATAEARERAVEKAMAEKAAFFEARERVERSVADKFSASSRDSGMRQNSSSSDLQDLSFQSAGSSSGSRYPYSSVHGAYYNTARFEEAGGESAQRCKARLERHRRTAERAAKALAEKNMRDLLAQREQVERNRLAETLDADVKRWSSGKEGNLRALLSTLQYILGFDSGWQPIPLTDVITAVAVKKAYRKATLCVHPDKLQQRGASIQQKYICEKVFDLLKEAWNKFNSEER